MPDTSAEFYVPVPLSRSDFMDSNGDTWHYDPIGKVWYSESKDEPDPQALLDELSSYHAYVAELRAYTKGLRESAYNTARAMERALGNTSGGAA